MNHIAASVVNVCYAANFIHVINVYLVMLNASNVLKMHTYRQCVILMFISLQVMLHSVIPISLSRMFQMNHTVKRLMILFYQICVILMTNVFLVKLITNMWKIYRVHQILIETLMLLNQMLFDSFIPSENLIECGEHVLNELESD